MKKINICSWIIIDDLNRILLIKRKYNAKEFPNYWALPWWYQDEWETLEQAAIREVKEEVWLNFEITELFIENELIIKERNRINNFYRYLWKTSGKLKIQEEECDWYWWFSYKETESLLIYLNMKEIIEKLYLEKLIK